ncbi:MAG: hypothetical protein WDW36_010231 [Sanguina aurantia]
MAQVRHARHPAGNTRAPSSIARLVVLSTLLLVLAPRASASAGNAGVVPPVPAAPVVDQAPKDRLEMHAADDDQRMNSTAPLDTSLQAG